MDPRQSRTLVAARLAVHHAAQVASALGATHLEADEAHQYANLGWDPDLGALVGREVGGLRAGLDVGGLAWLVADGSGGLARLPAQGRTLSEGLEWLRAQVVSRGLPDRPLAPVGYDLPDDPAANGEPLGPVDPGHLAQLRKWFADAARALEEVRAAHPGASEVRCWPHHLDIATLVSLGDGRSIGAGMTPGDGGIAQPYYYVSPWPYPEVRKGPDLPSGSWNTEGWFGAVLLGSELVSGDRSEQVGSFLDAAIEACEEILAR